MSTLIAQSVTGTPRPNTGFGITTVMRPIVRKPKADMAAAAIQRRADQVRRVPRMVGMAGAYPAGYAVMWAAGLLAREVTSA